MEKKVSSPKVLNIVLCIVILLVFVLTIGTKTNAEVFNDNSGEVVPLSKQIGYTHLSLEDYYKKDEYTEPEEELALVLNSEYYINENIETIKFFSKLFDYNFEDIIEDLKSRDLLEDDFSYTNIGYLKDSDNNLNIYSSFEYGLIEYFYNLNETKEINRNVKYIPYNGDSAYVEDLITYFSTIYDNVDKTTLLSIGAAESGYYTVKFMLKYNNIYGGMSSSGLIKHNNIEQGVLSYVRLMSRNYYGRGLNTLESIGRVYCPRYENGYKVASPHWINLVTNAKNKYNEYNNTITINDLINIEEV